MSSYASNGTFSTGITLSAGTSPEPARVPKGLIATRAVEVKAGWIGQVIVAESVLFETEPMSKAVDAEEEATAYVIDRIVGLLSVEPLDTPATTEGEQDK